MNVCIYTPILELAEILTQKIESTGQNCFKFNSQESLVEFLASVKYLPDLLILDYTTINHNLFNIYTELQSIDKLFPIIFYNDPCLVSKDRTKHWKTIIDFFIQKKEDSFEEDYITVFSIIKKVIESPSIRPYIPLMQQPLQFPEELSLRNKIFDKISKQNDDSITLLKKRIKIPDNLFYLLKVLYENKEKGLTLEEIIECYKKDDKSLTINSLRVFISKLKKLLSEDSESQYLLLKVNNKYKIEF